jgi:hypothetical protein
MKLVGVRSLQADRPTIRDIMKKHEVQIYSETAIVGHTPASVAKFGWFATTDETPSYATLCFAIIADEAAAAIVGEIGKLSERERSDHPIRAFLVPVEHMV